MNKIGIVFSVYAMAFCCGVCSDFAFAESVVHFNERMKHDLKIYRDDTGSVRALGARNSAIEKRTVKAISESVNSATRSLFPDKWNTTPEQRAVLTDWYASNCYGNPTDNAGALREVSTKIWYASLPLAKLTEWPPHSEMKNKDVVMNLFKKKGYSVDSLQSQYMLRDAIVISLGHEIDRDKCDLVYEHIEGSLSADVDYVYKLIDKINTTHASCGYVETWAESLKLPCVGMYGDCRQHPFMNEAVIRMNIAIKDPAWSKFVSRKLDVDWGFTSISKKPTHTHKTECRDYYEAALKDVMDGVGMAFVEWKRDESGNAIPDKLIK